MADILRFGSFELDPHRGELRRDGALVKLAPQPFRALQLLVSREGALVTRDELRAALRDDGSFVDFNAGLNFCIGQVRAAIDDPAAASQSLVSVPRRGYRFVALADAGPQELLSRVDYFKQAIAADAGFADAHAGLADARLTIGNYRVESPQASYAAARSAATRALQLEPASAPAHAALQDTGGTAFAGTVQNNGDFAATATFGPDTSGNTLAQRLAGRFTTTGFGGPLDVEVSPRNCRFTRTWSATKQGAPNVFP